MSTPFNQLPISVHPLSTKEREDWLAVMDHFLAYAGSPGDWGYGSKLGQIVQAVHGVRIDMLKAREE